MTSTGTAADIGVSDAVDAHHHIWRQADLPWLSGPMRPRIFGPYEPIRRDYLGNEYGHEVGVAGFSASVYIQANWPLDRSVNEVRWVHQQHEESGWPSAIVGSADLFSEEASEVFAAQNQATPLMRGTRLQLHWHQNEQYRFASAPDRMHDRMLRRNIGLLADLGWVFELQVFSSQMNDAARFVADFPETTFILVHAGMLESTDEAHVTPWRQGLESLAARPNVVCKLSGQGTFLHRVDADLIKLVTATAIELFGSRRCVFGTNLPVEKIWTDPAVLLGTWFSVLSTYPQEVRQDVLANTARRVYRL
jgi:predicted TIM-barrel fold metal-dependent hydrolase